MKVRGSNPIKSGQIVKRDNAPKMLSNIPKSQNNHNGTVGDRVPYRKRLLQGDNKNSTAFIDTSQKIQTEIENETIRSGPKNK